MIQRLTLNNVQKHASLTLDFEPGVNALVGDTGAGKSSALRGLYWLCLGGPSGGLCKHGQTEVRASAVIDGRKITRWKNKTENCYRLGKPYSAVKTGVPPDVESFLNVSELNFQRQLDPPFLLTLPAPEVARQLNRVISLELIDRVLSSLDGQVRKARASHKDADSQAEALKKVVEEGAWIQDALSELDTIDSIQTVIIENQTRIVCTGSRLKAYRDTVSACLNAADNVRDAKTAINLANDCIRRATGIQNLSDKLSRLTEPLPPSPSPPDVTEAVGLLTLTTSRGRSVRELTQKLDRYRDLTQQSQRARELCRKTQTALSQLKKGACPLCGTTPPASS
jgi:hypothetical protein